MWKTIDKMRFYSEIENISEVKSTLFIFSICKSDLKSEQWALVLTKLASVMSLF